MPRPGPRCTKQNVMWRNRGSLGDTTDDDSVDRTDLEEKENRIPKPSLTRHTRVRDSNFHSPEIENNVTDYGLEFTTSNIQNPSPRRCSTFKTASSQEEQVSARRTMEETQQSVGSKQAMKQNAGKGVKKQPSRTVGEDSSSDGKEEGSDGANLSEDQLTRAVRGRTKKQTVSKVAKKQNIRKEVKKQTVRRSSDSDDSGSSGEEVEGSARGILRDKQVAGAQRSKGRKEIPSREAETQIASKEQMERNASKVTRKQRVGGDSATEEDEEGSSEDTLSTVMEKTQGNSKNPTQTKQHPSTLKSRPETKISAPREQSQQVPMSSALRGPTKAKQISEGPNKLSTQVGAVKKARKQLNPIQKERRFWREVDALQKQSNHLIPLLPFSRTIRQIMMQTSRHVTQITPTALEAIQTASEMYLTQRLQDAYMLTLHRGRVTLDVKDMELIKHLKFNV